MTVKVTIAVALFLIAVTAGELAAQTLDEVRRAVDESWDMDEAEVRLEDWGDDALPFLAELLDDPDSMLRLRVDFVLTGMLTPEATEVLLTAVEHHHPSDVWEPEMIEALEQFASEETLEQFRYPVRSTAFDELVSRAVDAETRSLVQGERYRTVMLALADRVPHNGDVQEGVARVIAHMGWEEELPRVRELLEHPDLEVRATAADALELLTGERAVDARPVVAFPAEALDEDLVEHVGAIDYAYVDFFAFGRWDGVDRLVTSGDLNSIEVRDERLEVVQRMVIDQTVLGVFAAPTADGGQQFICYLSDEDSLPDEYMVGLDEDGSERWRLDFDGGSLENMAPLHRRGELVGVLVDVEEEDETSSIAALDLDGNVLWWRSLEYDNHYFARPRLFSHSAFDSLVSVVGEGWVSVLDAEGDPYVAPDHGPVEGFLRRLAWVTVRVLVPEEMRLQMTQAIPVPEGPDQHALVFGGFAGQEHWPALWHENAKGTVTWTATLPSPVAGLCLVEPEAGGRWLVVAATLSGEFFVVEDGGTLVHRGRFEETRMSHGADSAEVMVAAIVSGRLGDRRAFAISAFDLNVYRLR